MSGLTRSDIEDILRLIDGSAFDELTLEMGDTRIELRRRGAAASERTVAPSASSGATPVAPGAEPASSSQAPAATAEAAGEGTPVAAPLLGTFYHAPKPGADPFVAVGDRVAADSVIGIIEVMKLMNQVPAGISGTVTRILAPDGELVEHGQSLILVKPD